jgi:hypothetical protein
LDIRHVTHSFGHAEHDLQRINVKLALRHFAGATYLQFSEYQAKLMAVVAAVKSKLSAGPPNPIQIKP